jgi:hypothetical protein
MRLVSGEIVIDRPRDEVFDYVTDSRNEPDYNHAMRHVEKTTPGPLRRGTEFVATVRSMGRTVPMTTVITDYERPVLSVSTTHMVSMDVHGTLTFMEVAPGRTKMRWDWQLKPRGWFRLLSPLTTRLGQWHERHIWKRMKHLVESGPRWAGSTPD